MPTVDTIRKNLEPVFSSYKVRKAILFGSFAKGTARENSDIDIYVESGLKGLSFYGLLEDVVNCLERPVDLIDASQVKPESKIMSEIIKTGVVIFNGREIYNAG